MTPTSYTVSISENSSMATPRSLSQGLNRKSGPLHTSLYGTVIPCYQSYQCLYWLHTNGTEPPGTVSLVSLRNTELLESAVEGVDSQEGVDSGESETVQGV